MPDFYEFFAGGGMARAGFGPGWRCQFANDFDAMKAAVYRNNWGMELACRDVAEVSPADLPGTADLAWASFPCQDVSLAGDGAGVGNKDAAILTRSGSFWPFWNLICKLGEQGRSPPLIALENVTGLITSRNGSDFSSIATALSGAGYRFGALVVDAAHFLPHSRPRLFIVCVRKELPIPAELMDFGPSKPWHSATLRVAAASLPESVRQDWVWWRLPIPARTTLRFVDIIESEPTGVNWHTEAETNRLLGMMSILNAQKVEAAKRAGHLMVGGVYRRTRPDSDGVRSQRAEVRFDDIAGCLRTPAGGSSRQTILIIKGANVRSRLLSPREAARLMGLPDSYRLPHRYNDAYHIAGDGVAVPVVRYLAAHLLEPILATRAAHEARQKLEFGQPLRIAAE